MPWLLFSETQQRRLVRKGGYKGGRCRPGGFLTTLYFVPSTVRLVYRLLISRGKSLVQEIASYSICCFPMCGLDKTARNYVDNGFRLMAVV